jgi:hypothetical protein
VVDGEPLAAATETCHHFVADQHDSGAIADRADTREIARRRHEDAVRTDDRLDHDRRDVVCALDHDDVFEMLQCTLGLFSLVLRMELRTVRVRAPELDDAR